MNKNQYSDIKIFRFPDKVESFKTWDVQPPIYVRIKPINLCNHGCFFCVYSTGFRFLDNGEVPHIDSGMHADMKEKDKIPFGKLSEILNDLSNMGTRAVTFSGGGEPLIYPKIVDALELTTALGIDLSIITNGQQLNGRRSEALRNAKWVRVSMDYSNETEMKKFRNVPSDYFTKVIDNISTFSKQKLASCDLGVNFIVHKDNYQNIFSLAEILKDSGVDNLRISPMYTKDFGLYHAEIESEVKKVIDKVKRLSGPNFVIYSTYNAGSSTSHSHFRDYDRCYILETVPVIGADQRVYACHNKAYDTEGVMGDLTNKSFREFWYSDEFKEFRRNFSPRRKCMHECSNDRKNIFINQHLNNPEDNFI